MTNFIFKLEYSWILFPLLLILYFYIPEYVSPLMFCVALIGTIEMLFYDSTLPLFQKIISIFLHLVLLIGLFKINKVNLNNKINYLLLFLSILFILFIPHYPYFMSRYILLFYFILIYIITLIINYMYFII